MLKQIVLTRGARGIFYDTRDLLKVIRGTYNAVVKTTELEVLRPVMEAELLVLDDLGASLTDAAMSPVGVPRSGHGVPPTTAGCACPRHSCR